jgi:hypothetical protein
VGDVHHWEAMMMRLFAFTMFAMLVGGLMPKPVAAQDAKPLDAAATAKIKAELMDAFLSFVKMLNAHDTKGLAENGYVVPSFFVLATGVVLPNLQGGHCHSL